MDEVINKLLSEKGFNPGDAGYDDEKERLTELVENKMSEAMVDAIIETDRLEMLRKVLKEEPDNAEKIQEIALGSELRVEVLENAMNELRKEYLEAK